MSKNKPVIMPLIIASTVATGVLGSCCRPPANSEDCTAVLTQLSDFELGDSVALPDPASLYCHQIGGQTRIETSEAGQYGICVLPDGTERSQWDLFCDECVAPAFCPPEWND